MNVNYFNSKEMRGGNVRQGIVRETTSRIVA
jgi:hypothetical protein